MEKTKELTLSDWEKETLTKKQTLYAADDAIISFHLFVTMLYHRSWDDVATIEYAPKDRNICGFDVDAFLKDKDRECVLQSCYGIIDVKNIKMEQKMERKRRNKNENGTQAQQQRMRLKEERKQKYRERASRSPWRMYLHR